MSEEAGPAGALTAESAAGDSHSPETSAPVDDHAAGASLEDTTPASEGADDDDEAEEDFSDVPFNEHPRFKALTRRLAKQRRQIGRLRPLADRVKGVDLDTTFTRARVAENIESALARRPELREALLKELSSPTQPGQAREAAFDPASLPFDVNDDVGKHFVGERQLLRAALKRIETLEAGNQQTSQKTYENSWRTATDAAAGQLPDEWRDVFQDAMYGAYRVALAEGKHPTPQEFVDRYVTKLKARGAISGRAAQRSSDAARQRIAEHNKTLPRQPAGGGAPAAPRDGRKGETVAEVSRRLKNQWARA